MTSTPVIAGQAIGSGANKGDGILPQKHTLLAGSSGAVISLRLTQNGKPLDARTKVRCYYTTSPFSITAANAVTQMVNNTRHVDVATSDDKAAVRIKDSSLDPVSGQYLYFWFDVPEFTADASLDATVTEL